MAASITLYDTWTQKLGQAANMSSDTFKVGLATSTYTPSMAHDEYADITNELSGNGYALATLGSVTFNHSSGTTTFDAADTVFTATGGSLVARYAFIYDDTVAGDPLIGYILLDTTPANVTVTDGNTLTLQWNASGIFTIAKV